MKSFFRAQILLGLARIIHTIMMLKSFKRNFRFLLSIAFLILTACSTTITTQVNAFRSADLSISPSSFVVVAEQEELTDSLEFQHYSQILQQRLTLMGFSKAVARPDYKIKLAYSVEPLNKDSQTKVSTGLLINNGFSYRPFSNNLVLLQEGKDVRQYSRNVRLTFLRAKATGAGMSEQEYHAVYQVTGVSEGRCRILSEVVDEMIESLLSGFPLESGALQRVRVKADIACR